MCKHVEGTKERTARNYAANGMFTFEKKNDRSTVGEVHWRCSFLMTKIKKIQWKGCVQFKHKNYTLQNFCYCIY